MRIEAVDPATHAFSHFTIPDDQAAKLDELTRGGVPDSKLNHYIDNLELSADAKALLHDITKSTIKVGKQIVAVGKRAVWKDNLLHHAYARCLILNLRS